MSGEFKEQPIRAAIIEQASVWFIRHRSGDLSQDEKEAFLAWLRDSKLNLQEYLEQVRLHQGLAQVIPGLDLNRGQLLEQTRKELMANIVPMNASNSTRLRQGWFKRRPLMATAAAITLAVAGAVWMISVDLGTRRISVSHGEQRTVQLLDGSTVHINASSEVNIKFSKQERLVELERGQALFEVARDAARPFRVRAGSAEVVAVGTQFDVYRRKNEDVIVTVLEGKVDVVQAQSLRRKAEHVPLAKRLRVNVGEQVQVVPSMSQLVAHPADIRVATAWMRREVIFKGEPLMQVAEELNRYIAVPVRTEDERLKKMRVRAVFNAYDSDSFLAFLRQYDVDIEVTPKVVHVRPRAASAR